MVRRGVRRQFCRMAVGALVQVSGDPERIFLLLIYAYMFKDLGLYLLDARMDAMYWAHHLGCWVIILQFFFHATRNLYFWRRRGHGVRRRGADDPSVVPGRRDVGSYTCHVATMTLSHSRDEQRCGGDVASVASTPSSRRNHRDDVASMAWKLYADVASMARVSTQVVCCTSAIYYATIPPTPLWARLMIMLLVFKLAQARQSNAMHLHGLYLERRAKRKVLGGFGDRIFVGVTRFAAGAAQASLCAGHALRWHSSEQ